MALRQESVDIGGRTRSRASMKTSAFRTHLAVYLGVGLFLFTLNLLTSPFHLWFYWPMFFWGWALVIHAFATYGTDAPSRALDDLRSLVPGMSNALTATPVSGTGAVAVAPFAAEAFAAISGGDGVDAEARRLALWQWLRTLALIGILALMIWKPGA